MRSELGVESVKKVEIFYKIAGQDWEETHNY